MTNAQIIFNESIELMNKGIIGTTGRKIKATYEKNVEARKAAGKEDESAPDPHYYMKEAYFFTKDQTSAATKMLPAVV